MKRFIARPILITSLIALALSSLCLPQGQVHAQRGTEYLLIFPSVGLAPGQTLRLTLFNPDATPVRAQARVHTSSINAVLADGSVRFVQAGVFHAFDFKRSDISLPGEAGTGRLQLLATCVISGVGLQRKIDEFAAMLEVIEEASGSTIVAGKNILIGGHTGDVLSGFEDDILLGSVPGQTLRISLFNLPSAGPETQRDPLNGRVKLFDSRGNLIAQSPELVIPQGAFRAFDFDRNALPLPGEPGTDRLQMRLHLEASTADPTNPGTTEQLAASVEVIDNSTGKTRVYVLNNLKQLGLPAH
jgi:hypothetical protein